MHRLDSPAAAVARAHEVAQLARRARRQLVERGAGRQEVVDEARKSINPDPLAKIDEATLKAKVDPALAALKRKGLLIDEWKAENVKAESSRIGGDGSPTKVKEIEFIVIKGSDIKMVEPTDEGLGEMLRTLIADHTLG